MLASPSFQPLHYFSTLFCRERHLHHSKTKYHRVHHPPQQEHGNGSDGQDKPAKQAHDDRHERQSDGGQLVLPEVDHVQTDARVVVPVHEQARAQHDARHIADGRGPVPAGRYQQHTDDDVDRGREDVDQTADLVAVLRTLDLDAGVLGEGNHDGQHHDQAQPVRVRVRLAGPQPHEEPSEHDEPAEQVPEDDHLIASHARHQPGQDRVVIRFGDDAVDLRGEHVRHGRRHGEEDVPDLHRDGEHRDRRRAGHRAQQEVGHVVVDQIEDLVQEDPEAEHRDRSEQRPFQATEREPHTQPTRGERDVPRQQDGRDRQLGARHAHRSHAEPQKQDGEERLRQRGEQLPGLLEHEPLVRHDVRVERSGQHRHRDVHAHDHQQHAGQTDLTLGQAAGEQRMHVQDHHAATDQAQRRDREIHEQEHAVQTPHTRTVVRTAGGTLAHIKTHITPIEARRQERQREHHAVGHLEHAVIALSKEMQQQRHVDEVDQVLHQDIRIAEQRAGLLLTRHTADYSSMALSSQSWDSLRCCSNRRSTFR